MPQPGLSHLVRLQPLCASSWSLMWPEIVSRDRQLRSLRALCFGLASLGPLVGSVVEELTDSTLTKWSTRVVGPHSGDLWLVWRMLDVWSNVDSWPCPANGSRIYMRSARPDDLKLIGERERTW